MAGASPDVTHKEGKTIVQVASLFNQLLQHFPRTEFATLVKKHGGERAAKGFICWTQFVSRLFCQLGHADSLREICNGLSCCLGRSVHLGISKAPCRPTLSYAKRAESRGAVPEVVLDRPQSASANSRARRQETQVPLQEQASLTGIDHHLAVSDAVSVGQIPAPTVA